MTGKLLVTGASGHLGAGVLRHLLDTFNVPASSIVAGSRDTSKLADLAGRGVETRKVDFNDPASLEGAFAGIDQLLIISTDALDGEGTRLRQQTAAVAAAKAAGVGHLAYTSMPNPGEAKVLFAGDHKGTEDAIIATGLPYTIFRVSWYMENYFMSLPAALAMGQWFSASGDGKVANIARDDAARAIAGGLAAPAAESQIYTLTGSVAHTTEEVAALASKATGKPLTVVHVTDEQLAQGMAGAGVPAPFIPTFVSFDTNTRAGKVDIVTKDAETLAGTKLTPLEAFFEATKAAFLGGS